MGELSPMMRQYFAVKENYKDCILMYRVGDLYEMFFDDAVTASSTLNLVLTGKDCGMEERAPMCGVPFHSCEGYIARLVDSGFKVAICEQMENPATAKGLVKREVIRVVTPGTVIEENMLEEGVNNFLASVCAFDNNYGICFADISTGAVQMIVLPADDIEQRIKNEPARFSPRELIIDNTIELMPDLQNFLINRLNCCISVLPTKIFENGLNAENIMSHFGIKDLSSLHLKYGSADTAAFDAILQYMKMSGIKDLKNINKIVSYTENQYMKLDVNALRNLELFETMRSKSKRGTVLWVIDKTKTAMGKRMLRSWLEQPYISITGILSRQNAVKELVENTVDRGNLSELLNGINDIERLMTRVVFGTASGKQLKSLSFTAEKFALLKNATKNLKSRELKDIHNGIDELRDIIDLIEAAIVDEPPTTITEGGVIKAGYSKELDDIKALMNGDSEVLLKLEEEEKAKTGIKSLKVRYNRVFGYYIEVTNTYKDLVPKHYIRKQTLTNCERYITEELKEIEDRLLGAKERANKLEYDLFEEVRQKVNASLKRFQNTANAIAKLDTYISLSKVAIENNYCLPKINNNGIIDIKDGRHPVVELLSKTPFVANDTYLDMNDNRCAIITGPNMAGKSTYMRQIAVICLLAQIGSYVQAREADIGICDAIYTRVGASDDLAMGQSTFMVEMSEVADILKYATKKSLLILDEIGRGTSTFDGMSIARAVLEFCADKKKLGAKTLFATHYHELTSMENQLDGIKNYNIAVKKRGDDITFLRRIVRGGADESYGIEVAKLSGIPKKVIERAKEILYNVENGISDIKPEENSKNKKEPVETMQMSILDTEKEKIIEKLKQIDINVLTPIEALKTLYDICDEAKKTEN